MTRNIEKTQQTNGLNKIWYDTYKEKVKTIQRKSREIQNNLLNELSQYKIFEISNTLGSFHMSQYYNCISENEFGIEFECIDNKKSLGNFCLYNNVLNFNKLEINKNIVYEISFIDRQDSLIITVS